MDERSVKQQEASLLSREGLSNRAIARKIGVSPTTVSKWLAEAKEELISEAGPIAMKEAELADLLLVKTKTMLTGIAELDPGEKKDVATAVDKLMDKYLKLTRHATEQKVTIQQEHNWSEVLGDILQGDMINMVFDEEDSEEASMGDDEEI